MEWRCQSHKIMFLPSKSFSNHTLLTNFACCVLFLAIGTVTLKIYSILVFDVWKSFKIHYRYWVFWRIIEARQRYRRHHSSIYHGLSFFDPKESYNSDFSGPFYFANRISVEFFSEKGVESQTFNFSQALNDTKKVVKARLGDDFNTAQATHAVQKLVKLTNSEMRKPTSFDQNSYVYNHGVQAVSCVLDFVSNYFSILGFNSIVRSKNDTHENGWTHLFFFFYSRDYILQTRKPTRLQ